MAQDTFRSEVGLEFKEENIGEFLLNVLTVGLYNRPDLILREYIQNSHDALCQWDSAPTLGRVDVQVNWPNIHIFDNGPGMDRDELLRAMSNLGTSFKNISASSGFMGIGKLAGLSMASRVEIHSSKYGIPEKNWVSFNSEDMLSGIWERRLEGGYRSILDTLNQHTRVNESAILEDATTHFTAVHLLDVHEEYRDSIEQIDSLVRSIGLVAPVRQNPEFVHAAEIDQLLQENIPTYYIPIDVFVNGERVYRPYVQGLGRPKEIQVTDDEGHLLAYGWACLNTGSERYKRQIEDDALRGIAIVQRGIAVGSRNLAEELGLYSSVGSTIYFRWYCGELHIVDPRIILSADRTRIRQSGDTQDFIKMASKEFKKLARQAEAWANADNAEVVIQNRVQQVSEIEKQVAGGVSRDRLPRMLSELGEAQSDIKKRKRLLVGKEMKDKANQAEETVNQVLGLLIRSEGNHETPEEVGTIPLSDLVEDQPFESDESPDYSQNQGYTEFPVILDIPKKLMFSPRESMVYAVVMQAIADVCGGRDSVEFAKFADVIERALLDAFTPIENGEML